MTLLERMDRFVHVTRLDRLAFLDPRPRTLRWMPLAVLAALIGGYALTVFHQAHIDRSFLVGWLLFIGAFLAANAIRLFGPRLVPTARHALDERERMVKARASALSGTILDIFTIAGCFYMGTADPLGWWRPRTLLDWTYLGMGVQGSALMLPTLIASWLQPRPADDANED